MINSGITATLDTETETFKGVSDIHKTLGDVFSSFTTPFDSVHTLTTPFAEQAERAAELAQSAIPETGNTYKKPIR